MVVIAGDVQSYFHGRHPHQEVNLHQDADQYARSTARSASASIGSSTRAICRASSSAPSIWRRRAVRGPVLVDVPMDVFSTSLPDRRLQQGADQKSRDRHDRRRNGRTDRARFSRRRNVLCSMPAAASSRRARQPNWPRWPTLLELPIAHSLMGKGVRPRGSPAAPRS